MPSSWTWLEGQDQATVIGYQLGDIDTTMLKNVEEYGNVHRPAPHNFMQETKYQIFPFVCGTGCLASSETEIHAPQ